MTNKLSAQQKLNERARKIGAKIELFNGHIVTMTDGSWYKVSSQSELYALIANLENEVINAS